MQAKGNTFENLEQNLIDTIKEFEIKLGYSENSIKLYYPLSSLNHLLGAELDIEQAEEKLGEFAKAVCDKFGKLEYSHYGKRFCITLAPEAAKYVRENVRDNGFLRELIETLQGKCTLDDIKQVFSHYSDKVVCEKSDNPEFDWLLYFEDGKPDAYVYCIKSEFGVYTYHRFTHEDYKAFEF